MKICTKCNLEKEENDFAKKKSGKNGLSSFGSSWKLLMEWFSHLMN